jgi:XapX domain-containing protein
MKSYCVSLAVGALVGLIYALLQVRSPAPPIVALVGLLGMVLGEQIPPLIQQVWREEHIWRSSTLGEVEPHTPGQSIHAVPGSPHARDAVSPDQRVDKQ